MIKYFPKTGKFIGKHGKCIGYKNTRGYLTVDWNKKSYRANRLAWFIYYKKWPTNEIDHINGIRDDNRISNLRDITHRENCRNKERHINGEIPGCSFNKKMKKWRAYYIVNGKQIHLGYFKLSFFQ